MPLPAYVSLDTIGRPAAGGTLLTAWGTQVDDDVAFLAGEAAWTAPTFANGWVSVGGGYDLVGFKQIGYLIFLRGAMSTGTVNTGSFTLPAGYRPTGQKTFQCNNGGNASCQITITTAGVVTTITGASNAFVSLDGICFSTI